MLPSFWISIKIKDGSTTGLEATQLRYKGLGKVETRIEPIYMF